jgi:hypothetical protein
VAVLLAPGFDNDDGVDVVLHINHRVKQERPNKYTIHCHWKTISFVFVDVVFDEMILIDERTIGSNADWIKFATVRAMKTSSAS